MYRNIHFDPFMFFSVLENCLQLDTFIRVFKYQGSARLEGKINTS